ncbi:DUF58 domain-containing protein [Chloroflexota bacterium]
MKVRAIFIIVPIILLTFALAVGNILVLRLFFLSVLVLLISYLWVLFGTRGLGINVRKPPDYCQVGDWIDGEITVFNNSRIPKLLLKMEENTDLPGQHTILALSLSSGVSYCLQTSTYCRRRGHYRLGPITATATDPFGFFSRHCNLGETYQILIYPETVDLPYFESSSITEFGYASGYRSMSQISPNASSVREYVTGDSLNHIHWHSSAHNGTLTVKIFDADKTYFGSERVWIAVDMNQSPQLGEGEETTEEYAITIAASLVKKYINNGTPVGLIASGDQTYIFPPLRGEEQLWRIMEALALMRATGNVTIDRLVSNEMQNFKGNSTVIIITPSGNEQVLSVVRQLKSRGNLAVTILLGDTSFGGAAGIISTARSLSSTGTQTYIVRKGDELIRALDSRASSLLMRYI